MSSEQSERIRAALLRSKAGQQPSKSDTVETPEETETKPGLTASRKTNGPAVAESKPEKPVPQKPAASAVQTTASALSVSEPVKPEVETTLPLVAASEKGRAALFPEAPSAGKPSESAPASEKMPSWATAPPQGGQSHSRSLKIGLAVGGVLVLAGLAVFLLRDHWRPASKASATETASSPLQVQVEPEGNGVVNIRWNPQSRTVTQAREGRLVVTERDQPPRVIALNLDQLKIGHLFYQSSAERVEFRLEVVSQSGTVSEESVLAVSPGTAPASPTAASTTQGPSKDTTPSPLGPVAAEAKQDNPQIASAQQAAPVSRPPIRSFTPPPVPQNTNDASAVLVEPPAAVGSAPALPPANALPEAVMPRVNQPPPPPQRIRIGGNLQAANLIKRVAPEYPPLAKSAGVQGVVRFTATIGKDGTIQNLQLVSGPPLLVNAATEAVKKWVYKPMLLDGDPVEVITQIDVNFALRK